MAIKVKSAADIAKKWADVTPGRAGYYESGAVGAGADWEAGATAARAAFKSGVSASNIDTLYAGGIKKAGAEKFNRKVKDVGVARFAPGVQAATTDMQNGMAPMVEAIAGLTLTTRAPRGSDTNFTRVREVGTALHKKRLALRAAGA